MTQTQETESPAVKRVGMGAFLMLAFIFIFMVLLVFPGFLLGKISRADDSIALMDEEDWFYPKGTFYHPAVQIFFYPAMKMMDHSSTVRRFYVWQYELAGGNEDNTLLPPVLPPVSLPNPLEK